MSITTKQGREQWVNSEIGSADSAGEAIAFRRACVKISSGTLIKTTADTDMAAGLAWDSYTSGDQNPQYIKRGTLLFKATGEIAIGDPLCPDDGVAGNMRKAVSGDRSFGEAVDTASDGEWCVGDFDFINSHLIA